MNWRMANREWRMGSVVASASPSGIPPGSRAVSRTDLNRGIPMNPQCRRSRGLKPAPSPQPSPGGRGSRISHAATCQDSGRTSHRDSLLPTPSSTLQNPRRKFSFSLREKAGMRAARNHPRAPDHGPNTCPFPPNIPWLTPGAMALTALQALVRNPSLGSTLQNPLRMFTLSLRERAGVRAARSNPRATVPLPKTCPHPANLPLKP